MAKLKVDKQVIRELADLLNETGLTEIEWSEGDVLVRVGREASNAAAAALPVAATPAQPTDEETSALASAADLSAHPGAVTSPMVGTAYTAPEPSEPPYVTVGDTVQQGDTVMIVEAMKTMNPIAAPHAGKVTAILVTNEEPVEFGQVLMVIE